jgi:hypothetical protein
MNTGTCRKCHQPIIWMPKPGGGYMRPLETIESSLGEQAYIAFNGKQLLVLQNGELNQVRSTALLTWHQCPPDPKELEEAYEEMEWAEATKPVVVSSQPPPWEEAPVEETEIERVTAEEVRINAENAAWELQNANAQRPHAPLTGRGQYAAVSFTPEEALRRQMRNRQAQAARNHGEFLLAPCPACGVREGAICVNVGSRSWSPKVRANSPTLYNLQPHQERKDCAYGMGVIEQTWEQIQEQIVTPELLRERRILRSGRHWANPSRTEREYWETKAAFLRHDVEWADFWTTAPEGDDGV